MRIPKKFMPIVERLRAEAPRPPAEMTGINTEEHNSAPRFICKDGEARCPLGCHPLALCPNPYWEDEFQAGARTL